MKKFVSILLAVCIMMGICVTASAAAADTYDLSTATKSCVLTISSGRADFTSRFSTQTLRSNPSELIRHSKSTHSYGSGTHWANGT